MMRDATQHARWPSALVGAVVVCAAGVKLFDPGSYIDAAWHLAAMGGIESAALVKLCAGLLVGLEVLVGVWLIAAGTRAARLAGCCLLGALSAVLAAFLISPPAGGCGCGFTPGETFAPRAEAGMGLARNTMLIALLAWRTRPAPRVVRVARASGFTLIEVLVTIAVVAVLLAIALPALGAARTQAREVADLARLAGHGKVVAADAGDRDGRFPEFADARTRGVVVPGSYVQWTFGVSHVNYISRHSMGWSTLVYPDRVPEDLLYWGNGHDEIDRSVASSDRATSAVASGVQLTYAAYADPDYFAYGSQPRTSRTWMKQWGPQRISEARFPSDKALLVDTRVGTFFDPSTRLPESEVFAVWFDGSASRFVPGADWQSRVMPSDRVPWPQAPGIATRDGLHGRDR